MRDDDEKGSVKSAGSILAGRAFVELFADDSKLVRSLHAVERKLKASCTPLLASAGAAVQACFIRAGIANEVQKRAGDL